MVSYRKKFVPTVPKLSAVLMNNRTSNLWTDYKQKTTTGNKIHSFVFVTDISGFKLFKIRLHFSFTPAILLKYTSIFVVAIIYLFIYFIYFIFGEGGGNFTLHA